MLSTVWTWPARREEARLLSPSLEKRGCGTHLCGHPAQRLLTTSLCNSSCPCPSSPACSLSAWVCLSVSSCPHVPACVCSHICTSPLASVCLALNNCSSCLAAPCTSMCSCFFLLGYTRVPLPTSAFQLLPASPLAFVHLPPLALFIVVNMTDTCIRATCAQVGWNRAGQKLRWRDGEEEGRRGVKGLLEKASGTASLPAACVLLSWKRY